MLALVAQGRTDRGIAEQLYVTRKTVEAHVRSILRKLDLPADATENRRVHAVLTFLRQTDTRNLADSRPQRPTLRNRRQPASSWCQLT